MKKKTIHTVEYGGISLPVLPKSKDALVPSTATEIILDHWDKVALAMSITLDKPALLVGETGTGKTSVVKYLAKITNRPYVRVNMTGYTTPDELIGSKSVKNGATYYEDGIVTNAMKRGAILVLDEINATTPDCMFILHGLLDEDKQITIPNGDVIRPHKDFRVFSTCNPEYEGTKTINKALIDRFPIILNIEPLDEKTESELLVKRTGIPIDTAHPIVQVAKRLRKEYAGGKITIFPSTRSLLSVCELANHGMALAEAFTTVVTRKTNNKTEQQLISDIYAALFKEKTKSVEKKNADYVLVESNRVQDMEALMKEGERKDERIVSITNMLEDTKKKMLSYEKELKDAIARYNEMLKEKEEYDQFKTLIDGWKEKEKKSKTKESDEKSEPCIVDAEVVTNTTF